jgi:hypothetical protein
MGSACPKGVPTDGQDGGICLAVSLDRTIPARRRGGDRTTPGNTVLRRCALFVRTLENGAHLRRNLRGFPRCALSNSVSIFEGVAHLRQGLGPAPGAVDALSRAAAGFGLVRFVWTTFVSFMCSSLLERPVGSRGGRSRRAGIAALIRKPLGLERRLRSINLFAAGAVPTWPFRLDAGRVRTKRSPHENKKSRAFIQARLRVGEIYRWPCTVFNRL